MICKVNDRQTWWTPYFKEEDPLWNEVRSKNLNFIACIGPFFLLTVGCTDISYISIVQDHSLVPRLSRSPVCDRLQYIKNWRCRPWNEASRIIEWKHKFPIGTVNISPSSNSCIHCIPYKDVTLRSCLPCSKLMVYIYYSNTPLESL